MTAIGGHLFLRLWVFSLFSLLSSSIVAFLLPVARGTWTSTLREQSNTKGHLRVRQAFLEQWYSSQEEQGHHNSPAGADGQSLYVKL